MTPMAYDDPILLKEKLLVMRNTLLIPTIDHCLIPLFLIWESGLFLDLDETPKHQYPLNAPMIENHAIVDPATMGMQIHLVLNRIFSYFPMQSLTFDEIENWDQYPVVFINPNINSWDPHTMHYAEQQAAMLDSNGLNVTLSCHGSSSHSHWPTNANSMGSQSHETSSMIPSIWSWHMTTLFWVVHLLTTKWSSQIMMAFVLSLQVLMFPMSHTCFWLLHLSVPTCLMHPWQ
jgi:hypothetical protein